MAAANGLYNPNQIYIGQWLTIPQTSYYAPQARYHVVQYGETLSGIALYYGVSQASLMTVNGLYNPNYIYMGQRLLIP